MKASVAVLITAVVVFAALSSTYATKEGIIIIAPRSLEKNANNKLYMTRFGASSGGTVTIGLLSPDSATVIAETVVNVESGETYKEIELPVPDTSEYRSRIWANGSFEDSYSFFDQDEVYYRSVNDKLTFIQTDKPLYKPDQTVKFRVLMIDRYLKPAGRNTFFEAYVEDPSGSRIAQWKNLSLGDGIVQREFALSDDPPLGRWKITVEQDGKQESTQFSVEEYVLPKFEVTVTPPSFVLADAEIIPVEICAKYTYGKSVQGTVKVNCTLESYSWSSEKFPVVEYEGKIDGCYTHEINVSLVDKEFSYSYRRIQIFAQVTENGTEIQRNGSANIQRTQYALTLEFLEDDYKQYFKPGIPCYKRLKGTNPDGTPAPNEDVEVCSTISRQRVIQHWWGTRKVKYCRNYTTDEFGIIPLLVPPQKTDTNSLQLEAKSLKYGDSSSPPSRPRIYQPQTSASVQPFYSPSNSYIQIQNIGDELQCGTSNNIRIFYTAQEGVTYVFHYQVISKGQVIHKGKKEVTFNSEDNVASSMCKDSLSVNEKRILLVPSSIEEGTDPDEDIDCSAGPIGATEITIETNALLSPAFRLLVYYVRDDDETVADSSKFKVEKCFQNKVEFRFGDEVKQPGDKTSITLIASPNSLCGTKVLDKSIMLLDSNDQLTIEKVFSELQQYELDQYYHRNHCNDDFRKGEKYQAGQSMIIRPRPWSSSQYADALTAFEDAGFVALSDMKLLLRPCTKNQGSYDGYGGFAMASVGVRGGGAPVAVARPPVRPPPIPPPPTRRPVSSTQAAPFAAEDYSDGAERRKTANTATKSVVDVRSFFPETWLFELQTVPESGELIGKAVLPHTITEWVGNAACVSQDNGLGISKTATIKAFQAFFIETNLPYSVIRGENVPLIVSTFNYLDKCLPITRTIHVLVTADNGTVISENSDSEDICVCGGKTNTVKHMFTPLGVGSLNLTVEGKNAEDLSVCGDRETASVVARDMARRSISVEAEGFKQERVNSFLFCPEDYDASTYNGKLDLSIPDDAVEGSQKAFISVSGDTMGPVIDGLDRLVQMPTGCGEQNMVLFVPNIVVLDYLTAIGKLTEKIRSKATKNLQAGYQRELKYRHPDGSYSAFGVSDKEGSMWLTAFVVKSFSQAKRYIDVDEVDIAKSLNWIIQKQQPDGCFPKVGKMFSQGMKGGIGSQGKESTAPLTAYVLTALLVSGYKNETAINKAVTCIGTDRELSPYTAALYGYATAVAGKNTEADRYLTYLEEKEIRQGDEVYWKNINGSKSLDVETAAYAIMTMLKMKGDAGLSKSLSVVRHLTKMRNANGGFISTQDTVVGIEAIALFASIISQDPVNLIIELNGGGLEKTLTITEEDKLLVKKSRVPVVPSIVDVVATGAGCGLMLATVRYNTLVVPKQQHFTLSVNAARKSDCKTATISACAGYIPVDKRSNMAVMEIKMVSGFTADKDSLQQILNANIKRYEIENNNVVIYFDELTNTNECLKFNVEETFAVEVTKPATVKVYDYYDKEKEESASYTIEGSC